MKLLKERILQDGKCFEGGILKVDNFINHQMDPQLMYQMAQELVRRFAGHNINKFVFVVPVGGVVVPLRGIVPIGSARNLVVMPAAFKVDFTHFIPPILWFHSIITSA